MEGRWLSIIEICKYFVASNDTVYNRIDKYSMPAAHRGLFLEVQKRPG